MVADESIAKYLSYPCRDSTTNANIIGTVQSNISSAKIQHGREPEFSPLDFNITNSFKHPAGQYIRLLSISPIIWILKWALRILIA